MEDTCHYTILDTYPCIESPHFEDYGGAVVGCWVTPKSIQSEDDLDRLIEEKLAEEGWEVSEKISSELVTTEDYRIKKDGREFFDQALVDDFAANIHRWPREVMLLGDKEEEGVCSTVSYLQFLEAIRSNGAVSLSSNEDRQWANGVSPNGGDFLPLWRSAAELDPWREFWPDHEIEALPVEQLGAGGFLAAVHDHEMSITICIGQCLVLTHPLRLLKDLRAG